MVDKITKSVRKFTKKERIFLKGLLNSIKKRNFNDLDLQKLKGRNDIYRVRKGRIRIIFIKRDSEINILAIDRRSDNTYLGF